MTKKSVNDDFLLYRGDSDGWDIIVCVMRIRYLQSGTWQLMQHWIYYGIHGFNTAAAIIKSFFISPVLGKGKGKRPETEAFSLSRAGVVPT